MSGKHGENSELLKTATVPKSTKVFAGRHLPGLAATARAQSEAADVHIEPRVQARSQPGSIDTSLSPNTTTIRKYVDLVLVPVTVTDGSNRLIAGLDQHNFRRYEDKQLQEIKPLLK